MSATSVDTPMILLTDDLVETIIGSGGYTHPLFNPTADEVARGVRAPLPGQGVVLLAGGLVEQSGALDEAVAMLEIRDVKFRSMVRAGDSVTVRLTPGDWKRTSAGKVVQDFDWCVLDGAGDIVAELSVVMLLHEHVEGR